MNIEINRIALYLSGKLPPYYKPYHKFAFIENLEANSDGIFTDAIFDRIAKYVTTDDVFYAECLLRLQKYNNELFLSFLDILEVPFDARWKIIPGVQIEQEIKKEFEKTIGFITPFDGRQKTVKSIIDEIISQHEWKIKEFEMRQDDSNFLWESVREFLEQYPIYIVDLRRKQGVDHTNINVALELWYILAQWKECIIITDDTLPSDIHGFKYIKPGTVSAWDSDLDKNKIDTEFKEQLKGAIIAKIKMNSFSF